MTDRLVIVTSGEVVLAFPLIGFATIRERDGIIGSQLDRVIEVLDRAVMLAPLPVYHAPIVERFGVVRLELDRFIIVPDRAIVVALRRVGIATVVKGDDENSRPLGGRIDQRRAAADSIIQRGAIGAIT